MSILGIWILYAFFGTTAFSLAFVWAVRARQFNDLERGRHIPLRDSEELDEDRHPSKADSYTWLLLTVITAVVLISAVWIGVRSR